MSCCKDDFYNNLVCQIVKNEQFYDSVTLKKGEYFSISYRREK